jgi:serine/threonine protein kinase
MFNKISNLFTNTYVYKFYDVNYKYIVYYSKKNLIIKSENSKKRIYIGKLKIIDMSSKIVDNKKVIIKINSYQKTKRELKILSHLLLEKYIINVFNIYNKKLSINNIIIQEYCYGGDLLDYVIHNDINEIQKKIILYQIIKSIQNCHKKNICHLDVFRQNLYKNQV